MTTPKLRSSETIGLKVLAISIFGMITTAFIVVAILPISLIAHHQTKNLEKYSSAMVNEVEQTGEKLTEDLTKALLTQKARDIADKLLLYSENHQHLNFKAPELQRLSVEKISNTGYSAIYDCHSFKTLAHANPKVVGVDGRLLRDSYPDWFKIWNSNCKEAEGAYNWATANGTIEKKYMVVTPIGNTGLMVAATMPLQEFQKAASELKFVSSNSINEFKLLLSTLTRETLIASSAASVCFILVFLILGAMGWKLFERFISAINKFINALAHDNYTDAFPINFKISEFKAIAVNLTKMRDKITHYHEVSNEMASIRASMALASQVSHDIRSPLAALEMILPSTNELPEDKRLIIRNAINRIRDIANWLLAKGREQAKISSYAEGPVIAGRSEAATITSQTEIHYLSPIIDSMISEKRLQFRNKLNVSIDFNHSEETYGLFSRISLKDFKIILSNIINNGVEALPDGAGKIEVALYKNIKNEIQLTIKDNGAGIPAEILPQLTKKGATFGKPDGNGLGLYHASMTLQKWGGRLGITSEATSTKARGTKITITLPSSPLPDWFVPNIAMCDKLKPIVFDDDQTIHQIWDGRFNDMTLPGLKTNIEHLSSSASLRRFYDQNFTELDGALFLMDYEIVGQKETGLDLIEELGIEKQSILVTSRYEEAAILERCKRMGVRLIPKPMSAFVPIEVGTQPA